MPQGDQEYQQLQSNLDLTSKLLDETHRMKAAPTTQTPKTIPTSSGTTTPIKSPVARDHSYITRLPTFADRGKAIAQRLDAIKSDPKYQALPDDRKEKVRADLYKKLVPASYAGFHLPVPDEKTWVAGTAHSTDVKGNTGPSWNPDAKQHLADSYGPGQNPLRNFDLGGDKVYANMTMYGAQIANSAFNSMYHMAQHFTPGPLKTSDIGFGAKQALDYARRTTQNVADAAHSRIQSDDFWLQTHPSNTVVGNLVDKSGEVVAGLPLWEVLGASGVGGAAVKGLESAPVTARLMASPAGKAVAHRLMSASAAYGATLLGTGGDAKQAASMAKFDVGLGIAGSLGGKAIKVASSALSKKWTASVVAEGGIPFAQDIATSAAHELSPMEWWLKNGTEAGIPKYGPGSMQVGRDLAIIPHGEDEGHFVNTKTNQTYYYKGKQEQQLMFDHLHKENLQLREQEDPVMAKLHEAEKTTLNSISLRTTGTFFEHLSDEQKIDVLSQRMEQIWGAAKEAPVHLPEQLHEQIEGNIKAERAADPQLHALMSQDEQMFGAKFADVYAENATEAVAKETGISNQRGAARSMMARSRMGKGYYYDKSPVTGGVSTGLSAGDDVSPRKFASLQADSRSYLRAPRDRSQVDFINDRSKESFDKTYRLLKQADGGLFQAEHPIQRFLYHYADKAKLPAGLRQSVLHWIKQTPGYTGKTEQEIFKESRYMRVHMYDMAKSGRLKAEGNVFATTKTGGPMSWSPWQAPLSNESDQQAIKAAQKALARHPEALKGFNTTVKALQKKMLKAKTPEELQAFKDSLDQASRAISTHVSRGTALIGG